jgi:N-acetylmuramoyl-L-alanine amidase
LHHFQLRDAQLKMVLNKWVSAPRSGAETHLLRKVQDLRQPKINCGGLQGWKSFNCSRGVFVLKRYWSKRYWSKRDWSKRDWSKRDWLFSGLTGLFSLCLMAMPVRAGELGQVNFDENRNFLEFSTDEDVQPRAQLLSNPGRLVIELPGIQMGRSLPSDRLVGGAIQTIRFTQGATSAQIVVELAPGYTMDARSIQFRGLSPTQWTVQLPEPRRDLAAPAVATNPAPAASINSVRISPAARTTSTPPSTSRITAPPPANGSTGNANNASPNASPLSIQQQYAQAQPEDGRSQNTPVQVENIEVTEEGVFIRTSGGSPDIDIDRERTRGIIEINIREATLSSRLTQRIWSVRKFGVEKLEVESRNPRGRSQVRITFFLHPEAPDYDIRVRDLGGIGFYPESSSYRRFQASVPTREQPRTATAPPPSPPSETPRPPNTPPRRLPLPPRTTPPSNTSREALDQLGRLGDRPDRQRPNTPLPRINDGRRVVVIDPGHGGADPGAVGIGNLHEADVVMDISNQVASILEQQGVQVVMTRRNDVEVDLEPRVAMAEQSNASVFVSIHANAISMSRPEVNGLETYYYSSGEGLADTIHATILQSGLGMKDRGVRQARFYVLRRTSMPAVLVETGFVTGEEDAPRLATPGFRSQMATAIAQGILSYLQGR